MLTSLEAISRYLLAGKAIVTLVSKKTGTRFTYRIRAAKTDGPRAVFYVGVLTGTNNESDYTPLAVIARENGKLFYYRARSSPIGEDAPSAIALRWAVTHLLIAPSTHALEQIDVMHAGSCGRCGRTLTTPSSLVVGLGPECALK